MPIGWMVRKGRMIRYTLKCPEGHVFESWFASSDGYQTLRDGGHVTCTVCGSPEVEKALMAPAVPARDNAKAPPVEAPLSRPANPAEAALKALRKKVETESDYVGASFADEARKIHLGEADARGIWGEATGAEARELADEGIPVAPLPFMKRLDG